MSLPDKFSTLGVKSGGHIGFDTSSSLVMGGFYKLVGDALAKTRSKACRPGVVFPPTARQAAHSSHHLVATGGSRGK